MVRNYRVGEANSKRARARARGSKSKRAINQATLNRERRSEAIIRPRESEHENERVRDLDMTRSRLHYNMRVRHHEITRARKRQRMLAWGGLTRALRALVGGLARENTRVRG